MEGKKKFQPDRKLKLMDQVRQVLRFITYKDRQLSPFGAQLALCLY